jgi:hypothetical protein
MNALHEEPVDVAAGTEPADGDWIPRMLRELNQQYLGEHPLAVHPLVELMRTATDPMAFATMQKTMMELFLAHVWAAQSDWADAWWRFLAPGRATAGSQG